MHRPNRLLSTLAWYVGRFKLLTGIASLGVAGVILALSGKTPRRGSQVSLALAPLFFAAFSLFFLTSRRERLDHQMSA